MDIMQAIKERRSMRKFTTDPVSDDLIDTILEAGRWAPSWSNIQCSRFIVVRDAQLRAQIAATVPSFNPAAKAVKAAPVMVVVCGEMGKSGYYNGEQSTDKGDWYMFDAALATQNMILSAHSVGLGSVITGIFDAEAVAKTLEVPAEFRVVTLFPLGYPAGQPKVPPRKPLADIAFRDRFGRSDYTR